MQDDPRKSPPPAADVPPPVTAGENPPAPNPAWAKDLRELYNNVVEEPLPDSFIALLSQLDAQD